MHNWAEEVRVGIPSFPSVTSINQLVDALTLIIFTASVQHTPANYNQRKYMADAQNVYVCLVCLPPVP